MTDMNHAELSRAILTLILIVSFVLGYYLGKNSKTTSPQKTPIRIEVKIDPFKLFPKESKDVDLWNSEGC